MPWNRQNAPRHRLRLTGIVAAVCLCFLIAHSAEDKQLTVIAPGTTFPASIQGRDGKDYVDLASVLEPLGGSATVDGNNFKLHYGKVDAHLRAREANAKVGNARVQLAGKFLLDNGRGLVPLASLVDLLQRLTGEHAEYHEASRRLFLKGAGTRFSAELRKGSPSSLAFSFTAAVNPRISSEGGKLRLSFGHDPIVMTPQSWKYDDPLLASAHYSENENGGEIVIEASEPLLASFGDSGKTIVVTAAPKLATASPSNETPNAGANPAGANNPAPSDNNPATPGTSSSGSAVLGSPSGLPHTRYLVVIDPSHGGSERGAALSDRLAEKEVTLAIARRLRAELTDRGLVTFMIRDSDATISVDQRAVVTNSSRAAVYIAIHAGTLGRGVRVFTSMLPETTRSPGAFLPWETAQSGYVRASVTLAKSVLDQIGKSPVRIPVAMMPAPVRPLNNIAGAAIAVEVAPQHSDVDSLSSATYQQSIANSLAAAIVYARPSVEPQR